MSRMPSPSSPSHDDAIPIRMIERIDDASTGDRKSTRLNSSHLGISYAVFCLKKKKKKNTMKKKKKKTINKNTTRTYKTTKKSRNKSKKQKKEKNSRDTHHQYDKDTIQGGIGT